MKLEIDRNQYNINPAQFLRQNGWATIYDRRRNLTSYVKRLTRDFYPRLHLYIDEHADRYVFNMHLDQKKASYHGHTAHSADYEDNPMLEQEVSRLKAALGAFEGMEEKQTTNIMDRLGSGQLDTSSQPKKKSWWRKLFK